jgi:hypothetical protein
MASGQVSLSIALTGEDKLSAIIERSNRQMGKFGKRSKQTAKEATTGFAKISGTIKGVGTKFTELNSKLALVKEAFAAVQKVGQMAISGEIANNAEKVFSQIAGGADNAQRMMVKLREVSRGLLDDTTIQQFAGSLKIAGVEFGDIGRILEVSSRVALATGQDLEAVSKKIRDAALAGRQGEFDRLGVVVRVNEELRSRAEAEGLVVDEMTKAEQVSMRLDILTEKLGATMAAAGIRTDDLSTSLRSLQTDFQNFGSSVEQGIANLLTATELQKLRANMEAAAEIASDKFGDITVSALKSNKLLRGYLGDMAGLSTEEMTNALKNLDGLTAGFQGSQVAIVNALTDEVIKQRQRQANAEKKAAQEQIKRAEEAKKAKADEIAFYSEENHKLELQLIEHADTLTRTEKVELQARIENNKLFIKQVEADNQGMFDRLFEMTAASFEARHREAVKADNAEEKREKEERKRKAAAHKARLEREKKEAEDAARDALRIKTEGARLSREIEIAALDDIADQTEKQSLERLDLAKRLSEDLAMAADKSEAERENIRKSFQLRDMALAEEHLKEQQDLAKTRADFEIQEAQRELDERKKIREAELEFFQEQAEEYAQALERVNDPLSQLVDHEKGASDGLKVLGASMGAASAAVNVYANETDTGKRANERFVQGLPAMGAASGAAAAQFVKSTKTKALIQGGFEAASSIAAFASGNFVAGAGHAAASAAFFALAGKSGKKGERPAGLNTRGGALSTGGTPGTGASATTGGGAVVVNVQGFALGSAQEMGARMAQMMDNARETGLDTAEV